jgi:hypothetical protein
MIELPLELFSQRVRGFPVVPKKDDQKVVHSPYLMLGHLMLAKIHNDP